MKTSTVLRTLAFGALLAVPLGACAQAQPPMPGQHPAYLHALSDLRTARWLIEHRPGNQYVSEHEGMAIGQIDATIHDIIQASIDDGKDIHDHVPVDVPPVQNGRLHRAHEFLDEALRDVSQEEDDPMARGLKHRSAEHIRAAIHETETAIWDAEHHGY